MKSWRCGRGWHAWTFVAMSNVRRIDIPGHTAVVCTLDEKCSRCGLQKRTLSAQVPSRPKVIQ